MFPFIFVPRFRLNLCLGEGVKVAVGIYSTAVAARTAATVRLYRETNEPVHSKTRTFHTQTGSLLLPSDIKKAQVRAGGTCGPGKCANDSKLSSIQ